jgi:hypothetical protein
MSENECLLNNRKMQLPTVAAVLLPSARSCGESEMGKARLGSALRVGGAPHEMLLVDGFCPP